MADIQSATAENTRGKQIEERKKNPQGKNIMAAPFHRAAINNLVSKRKINSVTVKYL